MSLQELEKGVVELTGRDNVLELDTMMARSAPFFSELGHMYSEGSWQEGAVDMLVNLTDGTRKSTEYAKEQLGVLLDRILTVETGSTYKADLEVTGHKDSYGYRLSQKVDVPDELTLGKRTPASFTPAQKLSYLRALDGLSARMGNKVGEPEVKASLGMIDKLLMLIIRSEIQPETSDKNTPQKVFLKPNIKDVVNGMIAMAGGDLTIKRNSKLDLALRD